MEAERADRLDRPIDPERDHVLGGDGPRVTLVEYGSYVCPYCHAAHEVVAQLRDRFGDRLRYVYRHLPLADRDEATRAAALSGIRSGARVTPTFFIDGRRYEGAWDEASLSEAMLHVRGATIATDTAFAVALHEAGLHATLAGVLLAAATPTRPPANLTALLAQAQAVIDAETRLTGEAVMRHGPSEPALRALDAIHERIESPASKLLRGVEPWSSYVVLPLFALANAGVVWASDVLVGRGRLMLAIVLALVVGKLGGILLGAWLSVRLGIAVKPAAYTWRHVAGAGALAGIGFTMSLFIAGQALDGADYAAAKLAIFAASLVAGVLGAAILWWAPSAEARLGGTGGDAESAEQGTPIVAPHEGVAADDLAVQGR